MSLRGNVLRREGTVLIYALIGFVVFCGFVSLGVDWARVQLAKTELQSACDASARYAAIGLANQINGSSAAAANASAIATQNKVDGVYQTIDTAQDVEMGVWSSNNKTFTATSDVDAANAIRITLRRTAARGNAIPLTFGRLIGYNSVDIMASAIAMMDYAGAGATGTNSGEYQYMVPATSNPWLAGMPSGTVANSNNPANNSDYAGTAYSDSGKKKRKNPNTGVWQQETSMGSNTYVDISYSSKRASPVTAGGISVTPGTSISFDGVNGGANNFQSNTLYDGDGNLDWVISNFKGNENGMSDISAPINSVIAVFLSDSTPTSGSTPSKLDFSTTSSRDFTTLSPSLKQVFFIGDGRNSNGEVQRFIPPAGATRLFIGTMDGWEWNNNTGGFVVTAHASGSVRLVK
jgi:Flp pilus assembly protein TadG